MSGETEQAVSGWTVDTLKEHLETLVRSEHAARVDMIDAFKRLYEAERTGDREAVKVAFDAASALSRAHNDLLRKMEKLSETFATREELNKAIVNVVESRREQRRQEKEATDARFGRLENWQAKATGAMIAVGAVGLANFVKVWTQ